MSVLIGKSITKSFTKGKSNIINVLKDVSLTINSNEITVIVGASGAGKSTLLHILSGLDKPDSGIVEIDGINIFGLSENEISIFRNKSIGFIFQFHHLLPEFTALENVCMPAFIAKLNKKDALKKGEELLNFLNLSHRLNHKPSELSGGEQQRVAIARALINNPAVILADEPTGNLDSKNSEELFQLFTSLKEKFNTTFIIVTHDNNLAEKTDRVLTIVDGVII
jgi:lipoprotein-releasing system ATP-binding protein